MSEQVTVLKFLFEEDSPILNQVLSPYTAQDDKFIFENCSKSQELATILMFSKIALIIASIKNKNDLAEILLFLKKDSKKVSNVKLKVVFFDFWGDKTVAQVADRYRVNEVIPANINPNTLKRKIELTINSITPKESTSQKNEKISASKNQTSKNEAQKNAGNIIWKEPLDLEDDIWLIDGETQCRNILSTWMVNVIGPSSNVGKWTRLNETSFFFEIRETEREIFSSNNDGKWILLSTTAPEISWTNQMWAFRGANFELYYEYQGKKSFKMLARKGVIEIAKNSMNGEIKRDFINQSFKTTYVFKNEELESKFNDTEIKEDQLEGSELELNLGKDKNLGEFEGKVKVDEVNQGSELGLDVVDEENLSNDLVDNDEKSEHQWNDKSYDPTTLSDLKAKLKPQKDEVELGQESKKQANDDDQTKKEESQRHYLDKVDERKTTEKNTAEENSNQIPKKNNSQDDSENENNLNKKNKNNQEKEKNQSLKSKTNVEEKFDEKRKVDHKHVEKKEDQKEKHQGLKKENEIKGKKDIRTEKNDIESQEKPKEHNEEEDNEDDNEEDNNSRELKTREGFQKKSPKEKKLNSRERNQIEEDLDKEEDVDDKDGREDKKTQSPFEGLNPKKKVSSFKNLKGKLGQENEEEESSENEMDEESETSQNDQEEDNKSPQRGNLIKAREKEKIIPKIEKEKRKVEFEKDFEERKLEDTRFKKREGVTSKLKNYYSNKFGTKNGEVLKPKDPAELAVSVKESLKQISDAPVFTVGVLYQGRELNCTFYDVVGDKLYCFVRDEKVLKNEQIRANFSFTIMDQTGTTSLVGTISEVEEFNQSFEGLFLGITISSVSREMFFKFLDQIDELQGVAEEYFLSSKQL